MNKVNWCNVLVRNSSFRRINNNKATTKIKATKAVIISIEKYRKVMVRMMYNRTIIPVIVIVITSDRNIAGIRGIKTVIIKLIIIIRIIMQTVKVIWYGHYRQMKIMIKPPTNLCSDSVVLSVDKKISF
jgi:hypothetical protein